MSIIDKQPIIDYLKNNKFGYYGISKNGDNDEEIGSIEPLSIVAFVLSKMGELTDFEKKRYSEIILSTKAENGAFYTINKVKSVWSTSQTCLALNELGCDYSVINDSINWLCDNQNEDGGWSYNGVFSTSSIIHAFYTVILLRKFKKVNQKINKALSNTIPYLKQIRDNIQKKSTSRLMALYLLDLLDISCSKEIIESIIVSYCQESILSQADEYYVDHDIQNEFSYAIGFYFPASYLLLRRFLQPDDPFSQYMIRHLLSKIVNSKCWMPNSGFHEPMSWCTALSLYVLFCWEKDCKNKNINSVLLSNDDLTLALDYRIRSTNMIQGNIIVCPLNGGVCNLVDQIRKGYDEKKVFLDIPYDSNYEDFEEKIKETLKKRNLIPVLAKSNTKSSIILCKVCEKIQTCKYGIADISASKANVYFELGMLYGTNRKCALFRRSGVEIPADLQGKEYIEYSNTRELGEKFDVWLKSNIESNDN